MYGHDGSPDRPACESQSNQVWIPTAGRVTSASSAKATNPMAAAAGRRRRT